MKIRVFEDSAAVGRTAAGDAGARLRAIIASRGRARLVAATGTSQIAFLDALCEIPDVAWDRVELFHLDEYVGLSADHPASFRRFLRTRLVARTGIRQFHALDGDGDLPAVMATVGAALRSAPIDLAFTGIGENAHLAFNDPPADFEATDPLLVVNLDETCRRQQVDEGWFPAPDDVPARAITMSVAEILRAETIVCLATGARKRAAIAACFGDAPVSPAAPASILRRHAETTIYLDRDAASGLSAAQLARWA
jgi:glucosamine-6-phosphate deaminase